MNISFNPTYNSYNPQMQAKPKAANPVSEVTFGANPFKKLAPIAFSTLAIIGGLSACSDYKENRFSGVDDNNGIKVEYCDVKEETRDSVMKPVYELKTKLNSENDFIDGIDYTVARYFSNMDKNSSFKAYVVDNESDMSMLGTSFYSDKNIPRTVAIQEAAHDYSKTYDVSGKFSSIPTMRFTVMHETGHHFDNYFGHNHNAEYAQKYDSLLLSKANSKTESPYNFKTKTKDDKRIDVEYNWNNSLSDKKPFQDAFLKDLNNIKNIINSNRPHNLDYYTGRFDLNSKITEHEVDLANYLRAEAYATLFSYACGQDDGEKEKFINCFPSSYEIVKSDIAKYLNI